MSARATVRRLLAIGAGAALLLAVLPGCKTRSKWYDSNVRINRVAPIRFAADGKPLDTDVEFNWVDCPGDQIEIIRGDAKFAECMKQFKPGDVAKVRVEYHWDKRGYYDWDVHEVGSCKRPPDDDDLSSFDTVQECEPVVVNGVEEGFRCNRIPQKALLKKCPWFARH